jgi:hypothetical protein
MAEIHPTTQQRKKSSCDYESNTHAGTDELSTLPVDAPSNLQGHAGQPLKYTSLIRYLPYKIDFLILIRLCARLPQGLRFGQLIIGSDLERRFYLLLRWFHSRGICSATYFGFIGWLDRRRSQSVATAGAINSVG